MASILQTIQMMGKTDVDVFDYLYDTDGCAWVVPDNFDGDNCYYDYTVLTLGSNIPVKEIVNDNVPYILADLSGFVEANYDAFKEFTKDCRLSMTGTDHDDDISIGISTINGLVAGFFSEDSYKKFLKLLGVKVPTATKNRRRR